MPVDLERSAREVDIASVTYKNLSKNLQANIIKAHGRNNVRHVFIRFSGSEATISAWIKSHVAPKITNTTQQNAQIAQRASNPSFDGGTVTTFFLSASGYKKLNRDVGRFASKAFRSGMKDQDDSKDPLPTTWESGFQGEVDALVAIGDSVAATADAAAQQIASSLGGVGTVMTIEEGFVLRRPVQGGDAEPIEHFGYFDGISNPLYTSRDLTSEAAKIPVGPDWDPSAPLSLVLAPDPFAGNVEDAFGSYLVYRKLGQNVAQFNAAVISLATTLGTNPDLAGAMLVGRFKDGTPVVERDTPTPGLEVSNDFNYDGDDDSFRCPAHAHIRKANPRGTTPLTSLSSERKRRITRRGIPYGKPVPGVVGQSVPSDASLSAKRGLLFLCFQRNIEKQFEFIQQTWIDNPRFPNLLNPTGDDPLIGQDRDEGQRWPNSWGVKSAGKKRVNVEAAVTLKGGEYFFAPSTAFFVTL